MSALWADPGEPRTNEPWAHAGERGTGGEGAQRIAVPPAVHATNRPPSRNGSFLSGPRGRPYRLGGPRNHPFVR